MMVDFSVKFSVFLIISLSAVAETERTICLTRTGDAGPTVARRTVAAEGVFEGRSEGLWALLESVSAADRRTPLNVSFFVIKVHKGRTIPESRTVVVEVQGGGSNESCSNRGSDEDVFVVFIRQVSPPVQEPNYYLSDHIVPATEQVIRDVGDYACAKCGTCEMGYALMEGTRVLSKNFAARVLILCLNLLHKNNRFIDSLSLFCPPSFQIRFLSCSSQALEFSITSTSSL